MATPLDWSIYAYLAKLKTGHRASDSDKSAQTDGQWKSDKFDLHLSRKAQIY